MSIFFTKGTKTFSHQKRFLASIYRQNAFAAGALPRTALGKINAGLGGGKGKGVKGRTLPN